MSRRHYSDIDLAAAGISKPQWAGQARREAEKATIWLIEHDNEMRAQIDEMRAHQRLPPIDITDDDDIERAARRYDERTWKRAKRDASGSGGDAGETGWDNEPGDGDDGSRPIAIDNIDPECVMLLQESLREYIEARIAAMARGGRPRGDIGPAQLRAMLEALGGKGGKAAEGAE